VCVVHNETSTGVTSDIAAVRRAIDAAGHPALLMVDTISAWPAPTTGTTNGAWTWRQRLAEGPDAAAGHQLQRAVAQGAGGQQDGEAAALFWAWDEIVEMNATATGPTRPAPTCCTA
jgi:hypothetical protein